MLPLSRPRAVRSKILVANVDDLRKRTNNAFPEVVRLALRGVITGKFPVNLILDVAHCDECGNDASPTSSLDYDPFQSYNTKHRLYAYASQ